MRRRRCMIQLLILLTGLSCASDRASEGMEESSSTYCIQMGEHLEIKVSRRARCRDAVVQEDGAFVLPKLDRVAVAGRTLAEAQNVMQEGLREYRAHRHAIVLVRRLRPAAEHQ